LLGADASEAEHVDWCRKAFSAIVEEEKSALHNATDLLDLARRFADGAPSDELPTTEA
jgi:hypothetical protein